MGHAVYKKCDSTFTSNCNNNLGVLSSIDHFTSVSKMQSSWLTWGIQHHLGVLPQTGVVTHQDEPLVL